MFSNINSVYGLRPSKSPCLKVIYIMKYLRRLGDDPKIIYPISQKNPVSLKGEGVTSNFPQREETRYRLEIKPLSFLWAWDRGFVFSVNGI